MHVISRKTLRVFWEQQGRDDSKQPLNNWFREASAANWRQPADIKAQFRSASFVANNRVVFNIAGNKYRLIVAVNYPAKLVFVRFVGTHAEYDQIDATTV